MSVRCVLIVDDETSIRESLAEFLRDFDMDVDTANDAESALEKITKRSFQVVIADLRLPGMSGDQMIIKAHQLRPELHFLIHTGSIDYRLPPELIELGLTVEHIILKPLSDLLSLVERIESLFKS